MVLFNKRYASRQAGQSPRKLAEIMTNIIVYRILACTLMVVLTGCATGTKNRADLRVLYNQAAQYHLPDRNPVIVIPGILGSKLVDEATSRRVWGAFDPQSVNPKRAEDARLISLPVEREKKLSELTDSVRSDGVLDKVHVELLGIPLDIRAYVGILSTLGVGGYRDEGLGLSAIDYGDDHFTCFQFDYDWRRDNVENAGRLKAFMDEKRAYIQAQYEQRYGIKDAEIKFDIVAHSMGGLMVRYFLRYGGADLPVQDQATSPPNRDNQVADVTWAGADYVDRAILVAPPNAGSSLALQQLTKGYDVAKPILPHYPAALLGTFPSIYQLLPRTRHGAYIFDDDPEKPIKDIYDPALWEKYNWGLAAQGHDNLSFLKAIIPDESDAIERRAIALSVQKRILSRAKAFHNALDRPASPPASLEIFLVAGDAKETTEIMSVDSGTGAISVYKTGPGDGTVPRYSALLDERVGTDWHPQLDSPIDWQSVLFLSSDHLGLTEDPAFADNVLFWLLEEERKNR